MKTDAALRRIRIRLAIIYAALTGLTLIVMAGFALNSDAQVRDSSLNDDLRAAVQQASADIVLTEGGVLDTEQFLANTELRQSYPIIFVWATSDNTESGVELVGEPAYDVGGDSNLEDYAASVLHDGQQWPWTLWYEPWDDAEPHINLRAQGSRITTFDGADTRLAVIAVADEADWFEGSSDFRRRIYVVSVFLVVLSALAGWFIAGRAIRPTARSLFQQERLIADAAHELRTPVARIRAVAEGGVAGDEPAEVALARVVDEAEGAGYIIDDLLTLARMDAGRQTVQTEPIRLDLLAEQIVAHYPDVTLHLVPTEVYADPGLLTRAIDNLLRNAFAHGADGSGDAAVELSVYPSTLVVSDRGPGIDPAALDHLFDRFHTDETSTGHGLGLPIARWIVEAHGGTLSAANRPDSGATFTITFPKS